MADFPDPVQNFLKSFFLARYGGAEAKLGQQKLALEQQKFNAEQANHQADMKQRSDQFGQEMDFRKATMKGQQDQMDYTRNRDNQLDIKNLTEHGGFSMPTPQDQTTLTTPTTGVEDMENPAQVLMPKAATQPVGPAVPQDIESQNNSIQGLPMRQTPVPVSRTLSAADQLPDPKYATPLPRPLGDPDKNNQWYQKTPQTMALEAAEAKKEAEKESWAKYTPSMDKFVKSLDLGVESPWGLNEPMDPKILDTFKTMADLKSSITSKEKQGDNADQLKLMMEGMRENSAQLIASMRQSKGDSDADVAAIGDSIIQTGDATKATGKMVGPVASYLKSKGLPLPAKIPTDLAGREDAAGLLKANIANVRDIMSDPQIAAIANPYFGRMAELQQAIGRNQIFKNDPVRAAKLQQLMTQLNNMAANEVRANIGGRASNQMFEAFKATNPNVKMDIPMFMGALHGVEASANNVLTEAQEKRWGKGNSDKIPGFKESLGAKQTLVGSPPPHWSNPKDQKNFIPFGAMKPMPDPDNPGKMLKIYHSSDDDKFYRVD